MSTLSRPLLLTAALGLAACSGDPTPYDPTALAPSIPDVITALEAGDPEGALALIEVHRVSGTAPEGVGHYEGMALMDAGRSADAVEILDRELRVRPGNGLAHLILAEALLDLGRLDQALPHLESAYRFLPALPYTDLVTARVAMAQNDDRTAAEAFTRYLAADRTSPRAAEAHHGLGQLARAAGHPQVADGHDELSGLIERAHQVLNAQRQRLAKDPQDATAALGVGMVYLSLHNDVVAEPELLDRAASAFLACLASDPGNVRALFNLGFIAMAQDRGVQALAWWQRTLDEEPDHVGALLNSGSLAAQLGDPELAVERLETALSHAQTESERLRGHQELEAVLRGMGLAERAEAHRLAAQELLPAGGSSGGGSGHDHG
jgi:tetratricopeptide (TPR) repeat protein